MMMMMAIKKVLHQQSLTLALVSFATSASLVKTRVEVHGLTQQL